MTTNAIKQLIATYELPPNLEAKILHIASRQIEEDSIVDFSEIYSRISNLVETFKTPWQERLAKRLDAPMTIGDFSNSKGSLHNIISDGSLPLDELIESVEDEEGKAKFGEVLTILDQKIDQWTFQTMRELFVNYTASSLGFTPEQVLEHKELIEERANKLFANYFSDGKLNVPRRPIKRIIFEPELKIEFENRRYNGNPLSFFMENIDFYGEMDRNDLNLVDNGLYQSLKNARQLDQAIPQGKRTSKQYIKITSYRGHESPLAYYQAHIEEFKGLSRTKLCEIDSGLYFALRTACQLDQVIPKKYRGYEGPVAYYHAHAEEFKEMTRGQLYKVDQGLYIKLKTMGLLDEIFGPYQFRNHESPIAYYHAHAKEFAGLSQTQLRQKDQGLCIKLIESGELDNLIPLRYQKVFAKENGNGRYNGYSCALEAFYDNIDELQGVSRTGLTKISWGLYRSLLRDNHLALAIPLDGSKPNKKNIQQEISRIKEQLGEENEHPSNQPRALDYFLAYAEEFNGLTRTEFQKKEPHLYLRLLKEKTIDEAIPILYRGFKSPLEYFKAHPEKYGSIKGRGELSKVDQALLKTLEKWGQLDEVFPKLRRHDFRKGYETPWDYVQAHLEEYQGLTKNEFRKKDHQLAHALYRKGQLDKAISLFQITETKTVSEKVIAKESLEQKVDRTEVTSPEAILNAQQPQIEPAQPQESEQQNPYQNQKIRQYVQTYQESVYTTIPDSTLKTFFEIYTDTIDNDKPITLKDLSFDAKVSYQTTRKILDTLKLPIPRQPERIYRERSMWM